MLEVINASKTFAKGTPNEHKALDHLNLSLKQGEFVTILGSNGAGKSTMLNAVAGTWMVDEGQIIIDGIDVTKLSEHKRAAYLGRVFQDPMTSLNPIITIGKQITSVIMKHQDCTENEARLRALDLMDKVGIPNPEARFDDYPFQYSGGMRQRIVIAIALSCQPKILICDEPTTALDVTIQAQILDLMKDLQKKTGMGIIFITHNLGVVADICDKVSVMYAGKIVEQGPVDDIFYEPAHPYTKGLLRSMPRVDAESYERLIPIEGTPVDMLNPPEGCPFAPRCEHCMKICLKKMPPYVEVGEKHRSACWLRVQELMNKEEK